MARAKVQLDRAGMRKLLTSAGVQDDLRRRTDAIARQANSAAIMVSGIPGDEPLPITTDVRAGTNRARGQVAIPHPAGLAVEAKHRLLGNALDAGRH